VNARLRPGLLWGCGGASHARGATAVVESHQEVGVFDPLVGRSRQWAGQTVGEADRSGIGLRSVVAGRPTVERPFVRRSTATPGPHAPGGRPMEVRIDGGPQGWPVSIAVDGRP
jgi:hypothetical protein